MPTIRSHHTSSDGFRRNSGSGVSWVAGNFPAVASTSRRSSHCGASNSNGFTLVELLLVMAIMTVVLAVVAPTISHSIRGHKIEDEANRFVALTEYARNEAVSQGMPMVVWIDGKSQTFGLDPQSDYYQSKTHRQYELDSDVHFDVITGGTPNTPSIVFSASGTPDPASIDSLKLIDGLGTAIQITRTSDGWGYQIAPSGQ